MALQYEIGLEAGARLVQSADRRPRECGRKESAIEIVKTPRGVDGQQGQGEVASQGMFGIPNRGVAMIEIGCMPCAVSGDDGPPLDGGRVAAEVGLVDRTGHGLTGRDILLDLVQQSDVVVHEGEDVRDVVTEREVGGHLDGRPCVLTIYGRPAVSS